MKKTIALCTRVEGHGVLNFFFQKNEISRVNFEIQAIRGFENILLNKKLMDVPRIVSRVCGLCYASQTIASCKAIENMFEINPSEQSIDIRRLLMIGELINSHSMHFFFHALPDLFVIFKGHKNSLSFEKLIQYDPQLTSNVFELIKSGKELAKNLGGREAHPITPVVGGVALSPSKKKLGSARKNLQRALSNIKWILDRFQEIFSIDEPPIEFTLGNSIFLGIQNLEKFDRYSGMLRLKQNKTISEDFSFENYSKFLKRIQYIPENVPGIYADIEGKRKILVGPLARYNLIKDYGFSEIKPYLDFFSKEWSTNMVLANYLHLVEILVAVYEGLAILEKFSAPKPIEIPPLNLDAMIHSEGIGVVEAPRGTLIHHYTIDDKMVIKDVKLLVATEINIPTIDEILTQQSQKLYMESQDLEHVKNYAQIILRCFDPCISCATH